jgi:hypothetical protein
LSGTVLLFGITLTFDLFITFSLVSRLNRRNRDKWINREANRYIVEKLEISTIFYFSIAIDVYEKKKINSDKS